MEVSVKKEWFKSSYFGPLGPLEIPLITASKDPCILREILAIAFKAFGVILKLAILFNKSFVNQVLESALIGRSWAVIKHL